MQHSRAPDVELLRGGSAVQSKRHLARGARDQARVPALQGAEVDVQHLPCLVTPWRALALGAARGLACRGHHLGSGGGGEGAQQLAQRAQQTLPPLQMQQAAL